MSRKFESFELINSIRETNGRFDSCNSCKRLETSRLHELHESKLPFVSRIEFVCSKLSNFSAHASRVILTGRSVVFSIALSRGDTVVGMPNEAADYPDGRRVPTTGARSCSVRPSSAKLFVKKDRSVLGSYVEVEFTHGDIKICECVPLERNIFPDFCLLADFIQI